MLGSVAEADDAVQEAWIRLSRADADKIENLRAWLTTVVGRVCLNQLRSRRTRREAPFEPYVADPVVSAPDGSDPEGEALMADSVGLALLAVLETLTPAERVAFVLHDVFAVPFDAIAPVVGRSPAATRQLASRGRRRARGAPVPDTSLDGQWAVVDAFLAASRDGDFECLLAVLDPDVVLRADGGAARPQLGQVVRGAEVVASNALLFRHLAGTATRSLVNGVPGGVAWRPDGRPFAVLAFTVRRGRIASIEVLADPDRLARLDLGVAPVS
jgi:RNA polymerase sigma-70 factor (ECF subfamily)